MFMSALGFVSGGIQPMKNRTFKQQLLLDPVARIQPSAIRKEPESGGPAQNLWSQFVLDRVSSYS
jgi:hypothetical protein